MVNFGFRPLEEDFRRKKSANPLVAQAIDGGGEVYSLPSPLHCVATDRGVFFQTILTEYDFAEIDPKFAQSPSLISLYGFDGVKACKDAQGETFSIPFHPCDILVNRRLFPPRRQREDEDIWLRVMTERCRAIAHELIYAKQYANSYDADLKNFVGSISTPTPSEEDQLMCPTEQIERVLHACEVEYSEKHVTAGAFVDATPQFLRRYFRTWLTDFAVSEKVASEQTVKYLETSLRSHVTENLDDIINEFKKAVGKYPTSGLLAECLRLGTPVELAAKCRELEKKFNVNQETIVLIIGREADRNNGSA